MIIKQFEIDKYYPLEDLIDTSLLKEKIKTENDFIFTYLIEGAENNFFDIRINLKDQIISNQVSELVYFSFEIQRQLLLKYNGDSLKIPLYVLERINESIIDLKSIFLSTNNYEWYDHCVANRALFLRDYLLVLAKLNDYQNYNFVYREHWRHMKFISSNSNYDFLTNHGIITDTIGLLSVRTLVGNRYLGLANELYKRSLNRIDHYISDDGVPLESSSTYWFLIYKLFKKLIQTGEVFFDFTPSIYQKNKLKECEYFFDSVWLEGDFLRLGQSSGDNKFPTEIYKPNFFQCKNALVVNRFDTGLINVTGFDGNSKIFFQLLINTQNIEPKIHGHEDNGIFSLYYNGKIYFNTAGSFKFSDYGNKVDFDPKSFKNQSLPYEFDGNYLNKINSLNIQIIQKEIVVSFELFNDFTRILREIKVSIPNSRITINDTKIKGKNEIISQYLIGFEGIWQTDNYKIGELILAHNNKIEVNKGFITFERGQIQEVPLLIAKSENRNQLDIQLDLSKIEEIVILKNSQVIYNKRKSYKFFMFRSQSKRRVISQLVRLNKMVKV